MATSTVRYAHVCSSPQQISGWLVREFPDERQHFSKGTSVAGFTQEQLDEVAAKLNGRPRQTLGWMTPSEKLDEVLR